MTQGDDEGARRRVQWSVSVSHSSSIITSTQPSSETDQARGTISLAAPLMRTTPLYLSPCSSCAPLLYSHARAVLH